jgi:alpha-galactosidase
MKRRVKIVIIGAGSREFSQRLVHDLVLERSLWESHDVKVTMVDIDAGSLALMSSYARRCAAAARAPIEFQATTDRPAALEGADFVLISVAVKRMELWEQDFRVPFAFGIPHIYGENGGPGAAFHALRNFRIILPICADIERICPDAWVLNFTNPEARVLLAILSLTKVKAIGLCHGFHSFRRLAGAVLARPLEHLDVRTAGMNHFYTYYRIAEREGGRDLIPEFESRLRADPSPLPPLVRYLWQTFGALGYVSDDHIGEYLGFAHELVGTVWQFGIEHRVVEPDESGVDGRVVFEAWRRKMDVGSFRRGNVAGEENDELSGKKPFRAEDLRRSGELAIPVIADMALDRGSWREAVNVLNTGGYIENLDRDSCVELPATVDSLGVHPEKVGRLPEGFASLIRQQHMVQRLLLRAFREKSRKLLLQALLIDPVVGTRAAQVERMLDHMLKIQAPYLPELS